MKREMTFILSVVGLVVVWWYWRIETPISDTSLTFLNYDLYSYYYPTVRFAFAELRHGHVPLWNPYQLAGEPFFANHQHGMLYPPNVLYAVLSPQQAFRCAAVLHYVIAAGCAAYLARTLGLSTGATVLATLLFTFGGYLPGLLYLRTWLQGAVWLPLEFALVVHIFRNPRRVAATLLLAAIGAAQYLGGYALYSLLSGYCLAAFALWQSALYAWQGRWRLLLRADLAIGAAGLTATALCAVQLLPMIEMTDLSPRKLGSLSPLAIGATFGMGQLRTLLLPLSTPGGRASTYMGGAVLPLLVTSLFHRRLRSMAAFFLALALVAGLVAAGDATPMYSVYQHLPTSTWFRFPGEFVYLVVFGLTFAAAIGADRLTSGPRWVKAARLRWLAMPLLAFALVIRVHAAPPPLAWAGRTTSVGLIGVGTFLLCLAVRTWRFAWVALLATVWLDLSLAVANYFIIPDVDARRFDPPATVIRFLQERLGTQRVYFHVPPLQPPVPKLGMRYGLFTIADHESLLPARYAEYLAELQDGLPPSPFRPPQGGVHLDPYRKHMPLLNLLGVRFLVSFGDSPFADAVEAARYTEVFADGPVRIYDNGAVLPRAFVVGTAEATDPQTMLARLAAPAFDPLHTALVETPAAALTGGASGTATIATYSSEHVSVRVDGSGAGLLVLTDQYYPGWKATLDQMEVPIYLTDYIFRGVRIPAGHHTVTFTYQPRALRAGLLLSLVTVGVLTAWALIWGR